MRVVMSGVAGGNGSSKCQPTKKNPLIVSSRQGPKTPDPRISFALAVPFHVCYRDLSLVWHGGNGSGETPLSVM